MGKVYDALRRAEQQRSRRLADAPSAPLPTMPVPASVEGQARRPRGPFWRRWLRAATDPVVVEDATAVNKRRISMLRPDSFVSEQFRSLRARLDSLASEGSLTTISITSALGGEGKTVASVNLALVNAMSVGRRVLLIDCDMRKPKVHSALGLQPESGLAEVLTDRASLSDAVVKVEGVNLEVLAVRGQPPNPSELLASDRMRSLVEEASQTYDRVILDTPPLLALPDAKTLSDLVDGVLMVVQAGSTSQDDLQSALDVLDRRRVIGVVLNGVEDASDHYGYSG